MTAQMYNTFHVYLLLSERRRYKEGKKENTTRELFSGHKDCYLASLGPIGGTGYIIVRSEGHVSRKWKQTNKNQNKKQNPKSSLEIKFSFNVKCPILCIEDKIRFCLLFWCLWGATRHEASTFLRCRGHLALICDASCLRPGQTAHCTNHNRASHHCLISHMLYKGTRRLLTTYLVGSISHHEPILCGIYSLLLDLIPHQYFTIASRGLTCKQNW